MYEKQQLKTSYSTQVWPDERLAVHQKMWVCHIYLLGYRVGWTDVHLYKIITIRYSTYRPAYSHNTA